MIQLNPNKANNKKPLIVLNNKFLQYLETHQNDNQKFEEFSKLNTLNNNDPNFGKQLFDWLDLEQAEYTPALILFGPSGAGKTTLCASLLAFFQQFKNTQFQGAFLQASNLYDLNTAVALKSLYYAHQVKGSMFQSIYSKLKFKKQKYNENSSEEDVIFAVQYSPKEINYSKVNLDLKLQTKPPTKNQPEVLQKQIQKEYYDNERLYIFDPKGKDNLNPDHNQYLHISIKPRIPVSRVMHALSVQHSNNRPIAEFLILVAPHENLDHFFKSFVDLCLSAGPKQKQFSEQILVQKLKEKRISSIMPEKLNTLKRPANQTLKDVPTKKIFHSDDNATIIKNLPKNTEEKNFLKDSIKKERNFNYNSSLNSATTEKNGKMTDQLEEEKQNQCLPSSWEIASIDNQLMKQQYDRIQEEQQYDRIQKQQIVEVTKILQTNGLDISQDQTVNLCNVLRNGNSETQNVD